MNYIWNISLKDESCRVAFIPITDTSLMDGVVKVEGESALKEYVLDALLGDTSKIKDFSYSPYFGTYLKKELANIENYFWVNDVLLSLEKDGIKVEHITKPSEELIIKYCTVPEGSKA